MIDTGMPENAAKIIVYYKWRPLVFKIFLSAEQNLYEDS
jgi:hypothetical protein